MFVSDLLLLQSAVKMLARYKEWSELKLNELLMLASLSDRLISTVEKFVAINAPLPATSQYVCLPEFGVQQFHVSDAWKRWKTLSVHADTPGFLRFEMESRIERFENEFYLKDCGGMTEGKRLP